MRFSLRVVVLHQHFAISIVDGIVIVDSIT